MDRNWAVHYFEITQRPWHTPVKRARNRAFFAQGYPGPYSIWGTNHTHAYLHFALIFFTTGGLIYLFNTNPAVFYAVVSWVGYMAIPYTYATVAVFFEPHKLTHTPFSRLALRIYLGISYVMFQVCSCIPPLHGLSDNTRRRYYHLSGQYGEGILKGKRKAADEFASKPSSEIDDFILERILLTLHEDHELESFFDAIPGFCNSKLSVMPLSSPIRTKLRPALDGFLDRTLSSNLVSESVRASRLITCLNAAHAALGPNAVSQILGYIVNGRWVEALRSVEIGHALRLWDHRRVHDLNVRRIMACIMARAQRRDDHWTMLVKEAFGVPDDVLQDSLARGDSVLLSILIHISRQGNRAGSWTSGILPSLSKFDICNTLPGLQNGFCTLWNEVAQEARDQGPSSNPAKILREIRHLYISLHQGTDATPTAFSASTDGLDPILPSSYALCNTASHRPDLTRSMACVPVTNSRTIPSLTQPDQSPAASPSLPSLGSDYNTASQKAKEANVILEIPSSKDHAPHPSHTHGFTSSPLATNSVHITQATSIAGPPVSESIGTEIAWGPDPLVPSEDPVPATIAPSTGLDPGDEPGALQDDTTLSAFLSHPLQVNKQQDTVAPCAAPDVREISPTVDSISWTIHTVSLTIVISDSSHVLLPALSIDMTTAEPPLFAESAPMMQPDHTPHAPRPPSSSLTTASSHDTRDPTPPMTILLQIAPPAHGIVAANLQPEDQAQHDLDKL